MDWKSIVKNIAPVIGGTIGGPFGAIGMKFLAGKLLGNENATEKDIEDAILNASPQLLQELKLADIQFKKDMAELGFKESELAFKDRDSARQLAISQGTQPQIILSVLYTVGYFILLWQFMTGNVLIPANTKAEFNMVLGVMTAAQVQIMNFWFGSSSGSKDKTTKLAQQQ